ncbi:MAG: hypothetical protein ISR37_05245, partial [Balneolaceae bacterium]|nr:hypothetical protein [Balneolaceae bacterium]
HDPSTLSANQIYTFGYNSSADKWYAVDPSPTNTNACTNHGEKSTVGTSTFLAVSRDSKNANSNNSDGVYAYMQTGGNIWIENCANSYDHYINSNGASPFNLSYDGTRFSGIHNDGNLYIYDSTISNNAMPIIDTISSPSINYIDNHVLSGDGKWVVYAKASDYGKVSVRNVSSGVDVDRLFNTAHEGISAGSSDFTYVGTSMAVNENGLWLAVGNPKPGLNKPLSHNPNGEVDIFKRDISDNSYDHIATLVGESENDYFGGWRTTDVSPRDEILDTARNAIDISADGKVLVIGATGNDTNGTDGGAIYIYQYNGSAWNLVETIYGSAGEELGKHVKVSRDGTILVYASTNLYDTSNSVSDYFVVKNINH